MTVRRLSSHECPTSINEEEVMTLLGQLLRLRRTQLDVNDKRAFLTYYSQRRRGI
jgi:hypothetical protein